MASPPSAPSPVNYIFLPPITSFGTLLNCANFYVSAFILFAITFGIAYGITFNSVQNSPQLWVLFDVNEIVNICLTTFFMTIAIFIITLRTGRRRIITGAQAPLAFKTYTSNCFKRFFLFALGVRDWKKRIGLMLIQCFIFPTAFIIAGLAVGCEIEKNRHDAFIGGRGDRDSHDAHDGDFVGFKNPYHETCYMGNVHAYLAIGACYRAFLILVIFTFNYIASFNDEQPELVEIRRAALGVASVITTVINGAESQIQNSHHIHHSSHFIPTGQVVYAIPVEMNVIPSSGPIMGAGPSQPPPPPPPGAAAQYNPALFYQQQQQPPPVHGQFYAQQQQFAFNQQAPPPYVTNQQGGGYLPNTANSMPPSQNNNNMANANNNRSMNTAYPPQSDVPPFASNSGAYQQPSAVSLNQQQSARAVNNVAPSSGMRVNSSNNDSSAASPANVEFYTSSVMPSDRMRFGSNDNRGGGVVGASADVPPYTPSSNNNYGVGEDNYSAYAPTPANSTNYTPPGTHNATPANNNNNTTNEHGESGDHNQLYAQQQQHYSPREALDTAAAVGEGGGFDHHAANNENMYIGINGGANPYDDGNSNVHNEAEEGNPVVPAAHIDPNYDSLANEKY